jgi:general secretion pathway protein G
MKKKKKQYALTLIEIMIVIVLIGLIGSVIGANMKGSLDEGRAFKTKYAIEQIKDILMLEVAKGVAIETVVAEKEKYLANSGMVKDPKKMLKDGWGGDFEISTNGHKISIASKALKAYQAKKNKKLGGNAPLESDNDESDDD